MEDENDGTSPKMEQTETRTAAESKAQIDNFVCSRSKMEAIVAPQISHTIKKRFLKEVLALVAESMDDILQSAYENARHGVRSTTYNVVQHV